MNRLPAWTRNLGPGLVVAATGVGAGDLVAAGKAGAELGLAVLWAVFLGAVLKYVLAEGIARWQLATGETLLEGWMARFGLPFRVGFAAYLALWTVIVSAALMAACGLAAHALVPALSVPVWGAIHAAVVLAFVLLRGYGPFERLMKISVGIMFVAILGSALLQEPDPGAFARGLVVPTLPAGSLVLVLGVLGGIGGSLTLLSYNYWMREKQWSGAERLGTVRADLAVGYVLTGLFGIAMIVTAAGALLPAGRTVAGNQGILEMAAVLGERWGRPGELVFLVGFWGAVASSMLGVWQGVPYLFADFLGQWRRGAGAPPPRVTDRAYRLYLVAMTVLPLPLLLLGRPVWLVVVYAAVGSLFMPFLAGSLLLLNNRIDRRLRNGVPANLFLVLALALFAYLAVTGLLRRFG